MSILRKTDLVQHAGRKTGENHSSKQERDDETSKPLELLHMDLFGPIAYLSIGGK
jgi:hypothetical protein